MLGGWLCWASLSVGIRVDLMWSGLVGHGMGWCGVGMGWHDVGWIGVVLGWLA